MRHRGDAGDGREILHRVERPALDQALVGGVGLVGAKDQRVAVRLGARHGAGADDAGGAGAVLDHHRLLEIRRRLLADQPGQRCRSVRRAGRARRW